MPLTQKQKTINTRSVLKRINKFVDYFGDKLIDIEIDDLNLHLKVVFTIKIDGVVEVMDVRMCYSHQCKVNAIEVEVGKINRKIDMRIRKWN